MGRTEFAIRLIVGLGIAAGISWATFAWFDALVAIAQPLGVNATVFQNSLIVAAIMVGGWIISAAATRRLKAAGHGWGWALPVAVIPGLAVAIFNGPLFLRPYLPLPDGVQWGAMAVAAVAALVLIGAGLALPSTSDGPSSD